MRAEDIQLSWPHGKQLGELRALKFNCEQVVRSIGMQRRRQTD